MPAFYTKPQSIEELVEQMTGRILDLFGIDTEGFLAGMGTRKISYDSGTILTSRQRFPLQIVRQVSLIGWTGSLVVHSCSMRRTDQLPRCSGQFLPLRHKCTTHSVYSNTLLQQQSFSVLEEEMTCRTLAPNMSRSRLLVAKIPKRRSFTMA